MDALSVKWEIQKAADYFHHHRNLYYSESVTTQGSMMVIQVPPKVWRPKIQNRYITPDCANDIDKGVFDFKKYGKELDRHQHMR